MASLSLSPEMPAAPDKPEAEPPPPPVADGVERSLDPRKIVVDRIEGWIFAGAVALPILLAVVTIVLATEIPGWVKVLLAAFWTVLGLGLAWRAHRWPQLRHRHTSYRVDEQGIEIRKGVVWRKVINVPRSRVQHTDVSQGPLERGHGLGTLVIYTAGTDHAKVDLSGLDHATALLIREYLLAGEGGDAV